MDTIQTRAQADPKYTWDLTRIFASDEAFEEAFRTAQAAVAAVSPRESFSSDEEILCCLQEAEKTSEMVRDLIVYAMMKQNEDMTVERYQAMYGRAVALSVEADSRTSWLTPALTALPAEKLHALAADPRFSDFDVLLRNVERRKPHTLSAGEEQILAMAGELQCVPDMAAEMLRTTDLDLGTVYVGDGKRQPLTDAGFGQLMESDDRAVRRRAYSAMMNGYRKMGHTFTSLYHGQMKADMLNARARHFSSCREAALFENHIDEAVYDNLIAAVHGGISSLTEYLRVRKEQLGVSRLHLYDLYAGLSGEFDIHPDIEEAFGIFLEAVAPLGEDYVRDASVALKDRWIDVYENRGKRSGAYSCGDIDRTTPYVLLNHKCTYDGLSTLCHEMGHAMHSFYSNKNQVSAKAGYSIFVAEVASTTNEILLNAYLREKYAGDRQAEICLIGNLLEHFRTTVFRQTLFAEFEHEAHRMAEQGESITMESLSDLSLRLNREYYGKACTVDSEVAYEWMRIPHYYSPYYVYQYATGFCAAVALAANVRSGDPEKVAAYRRFLTLGGSMPPIDELRVAGVDMSTPDPVCKALDYFTELVLRYSELLRNE